MTALSHMVTASTKATNSSLRGVGRRCLGDFVRARPPMVAAPAVNLLTSDCRLSISDSVSCHQTTTLSIQFSSILPFITCKYSQPESE